MFEGDELEYACTCAHAGKCEACLDVAMIFAGKGRIEDGARRWLERDPFFGNNRHAYCEMYVGNLCDEIERLRAENAELREIAKRSLGVGDVLRREVERLRSIECRAKLARDDHADKESEMALYDDANYILTGQPEGLYT